MEKNFRKFKFRDKKRRVGVAIIGESGLGKSTLVELMCGFLEPTKGALFIDDKNLKRYSNQWKNLIGYVPQETFILNDTLKKILVYLIFQKTKLMKIRFMNV